MRRAGFCAQRVRPGRGADAMGGIHVGVVGWSGNSGARYLCVWDMTVRAEAVRARLAARALRCVRTATSGAAGAAVHKITACGRRRRRRGDGGEATDSGIGGGRDE